MVVVYKTASEGSWASFFIVNPQILFHMQGSIIPKVLPQVAVACGLGAIARWWNPLAGQHEDVESGISILGVLLSFLMVFKTQTAYGQFWEACTEVQRMLQLSRNISMTACTFFPFDNSRLTKSATHYSKAGTLGAAIWRGGRLKVRVIGGYDLLDQDRGDGYLDTIVRVGSQSFKTQAVGKQLNPVWDSQAFEFQLGEADYVVTFVLRDSSEVAGVQDNLGWLHLRSHDLLALDDSRWQRLRLPLQDGSCGELEMELCFTRSLGESVSNLERLASASSKHQGLDLTEKRLQDKSPPDLRFVLRSLADANAGAQEKGVMPISLPSDRSETDSTQESSQEHVRSAQDLDLPVEAFLRRIVRLQALYFFVVVEYFRRTGSNAVTCINEQDEMREQIKTLTGEREYSVLYPGERRDTPGSEAQNICANPTVVLYWLQLTIGRCGAVHKIPAPVLAAFVPMISQLADNFFLMDKIDKIHFPLPYAQVVKIVCIIFVFVLLPWVLQPRLQDLTELVIGLVALGFFGLDEVAEILESPFGNDPNHIDLMGYGECLIDDLELMYHGRAKQLDIVFSESGHGLFDNVVRRRSRLTDAHREVFFVAGKTRQL